MMLAPMLVFALACAPPLPVSVAQTSPAPAKRTTFVPLTAVAFKAHVLEPARGKILVVNAWASYCAPCLSELPGLVRLQSELPDVRFAFVSVDDSGTERVAAQVLAKRGVTLASYIVDGDAAAFVAALDPTYEGMVPATFIYRTDGKLAARLEGEQTPAHVRAAIAAAHHAVTTR